MDFALTDEQRALQATVRAFLRDRFDLAAVRAVYDDPAGGADPDELWKAFGEQGWLAVLVPESADGLGLGLLDAAVLARAFGAAVTPGPWLGTVLAAEAVRLAGSATQQAALLPGLAAGERRATVALHRAGGTWDSAGVGVTADGGRLSGTADGVEYAEAAALLVVAAREAGDQVGLYLVEPGAAGLTGSPAEALDLTSRVSRLTLDGVAAQRLDGSSADVLDDLLRRAAVLAANDLVGIAREALARTVAYDRDRVQFGKAIGSFQAVKHDLADLHVAVTMAEHAAWFAAYAVDVEAPDRDLAVAIAKAKCSDVAKDATAAMVQYHGGIGYTWEHDTHFFYKRARRLAAAWGDAQWHREQVARTVIDARTGSSFDGAQSPATAVAVGPA